MDGIVYLHNLAGQALQAANAEVEQLRAENAELRARLGPDESA